MLRGFVSGLGLICAISIHTQSAAQDVFGVGMIKSNEGGVQVLRGNTQTPAVAGQRVMQGDQLLTGQNSSTTVMLRDGTIVVLGPQSKVDLSHFQFDSTTQEGSLGLKLVQGSIRMVTGLIAKINPSAIRVETSTALIGVRGTDFIVSFDQGAQHP